MNGINHSIAPTGAFNPRQGGFTIIELVVVIILLGILAATALPRFMSVDDEAHAAVVNGVQGSLQTGASLFHAQWIAEGSASADTQIVDFGSLRTNAAGYPYGTDDNSGGTSDVTDSNDCQAVYVNLLQSGAPTIGNVVAVANVVDETNDFTAVRSGTDCVYYYTAQRSSSGDTIPTLTYSAANGAVVEATATLP